MRRHDDLMNGAKGTGDVANQDLGDQTNRCTPEAKEENLPKQWTVVEAGAYIACGPTHARLPPGAYSCVCDYQDRIQIQKKDLQTDDLVEFEDSVSSEVLQEIEKFWSEEGKFRRLGFLHRRGYLFYGPHGSGKSVLVHQIVRRIIKSGHVAFFCIEPDALVKGLEMFRKVEPDRPVACVFEDIDAIIKEHNESEVLQWLDGARQINQIVNLATTNYPEALDKRIVSRPRRFDRIIRVEGVPDRMRQAYLVQKMPHLSTQELADWVDKTAAMSFAALAAVVVDVICLGKGLDEAVATVRAIERERPSSEEFEHPEPLGFTVT